MMDSPTNERPTLLESGLNFRGYGYFTSRSPQLAVHGAPMTAVANSWIELELLLEQLKDGNFTVLPTLLRCLRASDDWRLKQVAARMLGHAGSAAIFRDMRRELEELPGRKADTIDAPTREVVTLYCNVFACWGRLDVVPVLMDQYLHLRLRGTPEIAILPILMADLLTDDESSMIAHEPAESDLDDYLNLVMNRYYAVCKQLGSEHVLVFRGTLQSVRALAAKMRHPTTPFPFLAGELKKLRERFESATGIDCSALFESGRPLALAAAAIAERFLESPKSAHYQDGERYFFSHRVPN